MWNVCLRWSVGWRLVKQYDTDTDTHGLCLRQQLRGRREAETMTERRQRRERKRMRHRYLISTCDTFPYPWERVGGPLFLWVMVLMSEQHQIYEGVHSWNCIVCRLSTVNLGKDNMFEILSKYLNYVIRRWFKLPDGWTGTIVRKPSLNNQQEIKKEIVISKVSLIFSLFFSVYRAKVYPLTFRWTDSCASV